MTGDRDTPRRRSLGPPIKPLAPTAPAVGEITLTGIVVDAGIEGGCLMIDDYLIIGGGLRAGQRVTVTGRADPTLATTCQRGTPLVVTSVTPA